MKRNLWQFVLPALGVATTLAACGGFENAKLTDAPTASVQTTLHADEDMGLAMGLHGDDETSSNPDTNCDPNGASDSNHAVCHELWKKLEADRETLAATPEWKALMETPQWGALKQDAQDARDAHCKIGDEHPSVRCEQIAAQFKADLAALKTTSAYSTAEATPEWQTVKSDYADVKANDCWKHHPHQQP